ncbi:putative ribonuclease H-like domain-containing protein [Tanacetum coccineum]
MFSFKSHSSVKRTIYQRTTPKNSDFKEKVNTAKVNNVTTAGTKAVVSLFIGHVEMDVKSLACLDLETNRKSNPQYALQDQGIFDSGCSRHMTGNKSYLTDYQDIDGGFVAFAGSPKGVPRQNNMYSFNLKNVVPSRGLTCLFSKATIDESNLWHRRFGHVNFKTMNKLVRENLVRGLPSKLFENDHTCVACQKGKQHKASNTTKLVSSISQPLQMLHMDLFGPTFVESLNKKMYCLVVIDDFSRCDNGNEFKNSEMNQFCEMKRIKREFSVARTPQQNGVAERKNRTLIEAARTILFETLNSAIQSREYDQFSEENTMEPKKGLIQALTDPKWIDKALQEESFCNLNFKRFGLLGGSSYFGKRVIGKLSWLYRNQEKMREELESEETRQDSYTMVYTQGRGIDYDVGFCSVARIEAISAFLYGTIEEEIYVCQPPGFEDTQFPNKVYKVEKALYGLHQALRAWYETLSTNLIENGFRRGTIDKTLFIKKDKGDILFHAQEIPDELYGGTHFLLRVTSTKKKDGIFISQDKYVAEILKKFNCATVKTTSTPMEPSKALIKDEEAASMDVHLYRLMIGSLMYLTASRPNIMFVVCACARFQVTPKMSHLHAVKRIFKYLKGQPKLGIWYPRDSPFDLEAFSDSDYAGASLDKKSTT